MLDEQHSHQRTADAGYDGRFQEAGGVVLIEVKRTSTVQDVRGALLGLAYALRAEDRRQADEGNAAGRSVHALLVITDTRLAGPRLVSELESFREAVRSEVESRIFAVTQHDDKLQGELPPTASPEKLRAYIRELVHRETGIAARSPRVSKSAVKAVLLEASLGAHDQTVSKLGSVIELQRASGASYPTVASALKELDAEQALLHTRQEGIQMGPSSPSLWRKISEDYAAERRAKRYVDPSGQALSPERMLKALEKLRLARIAQGGRDLAFDVTVGGVIGAKMHYPELDLSGAPRLDLCIQGDDLSFVRELDAGLIETEDTKVHAVLVLHSTKAMRLMFATAVAASPSASVTVPRTTLSTGFGLRPATVVDCHADLLELGLAAQAAEFAVAMNKRLIQRAATGGM